MTTEEAKKIRIADYLHSLGYSPVKQQGINLWYKSPFREENEPSFKVNTEREHGSTSVWEKAATSLHWRHTFTQRRVFRIS